MSHAEIYGRAVLALYGEGLFSGSNLDVAIGVIVDVNVVVDVARLLASSTKTNRLRSAFEPGVSLPDLNELAQAGLDG